MPTPAQDDEALQRICEDVQVEMGVSLQGAIFTDFAKAVARRYAAMVGAGVPERLKQLCEAAYDAGFAASIEGWNGECPEDCINDEYYLNVKREYIRSIALQASAEPAEIATPTPPSG